MKPKYRITIEHIQWGVFDDEPDSWKSKEIYRQEFDELDVKKIVQTANEQENK